MVNRKRSADPSMDVGRWKHVEHADPYHTWEKPLPGGGRAQVLFGDASPSAEPDWWSHIEYTTTGGQFEWSDERLPDGTDKQAVIRRTMKWMRKNQDWTPQDLNETGSFGLGMSGGGSGFF